jgi:hypothetical protein
VLADVTNGDSSADYIIIITACERKGAILGQDIFHATDFDLLPISSQASVTSPAHPVEAHLLALVQSHLKNGYFLFSYTWDLTRKMQAQWEKRTKDEGRPMWEVASVYMLSLPHMLMALQLIDCRRTIASFGIGEGCRNRVNCCTHAVIAFCRAG